MNRLLSIIIVASALAITGTGASTAETAAAAVDVSAHQSPPIAGSATDPTQKQRLKLKRYKRAALKIAKAQATYSGYRYSKKHRTLRIYATDGRPKAMKSIVGKAKRRAGLTIKWVGTSNFTRAELVRAKRIVAKDRRVRKGMVRIDPHPGELAVSFKSKYHREIEELERTGRLEAELGVDVPIYLWYTRNDVFPASLSTR